GQISNVKFVSHVAPCVTSLSKSVTIQVKSSTGSGRAANPMSRIVHLLPSCSFLVGSNSDVATHSKSKKCFTAERQQWPPVLPQKNQPMPQRHLRKIDAPEGEARKEHHSPFGQWTIGYSPQGCDGCPGAVGSSPGFTYFRFGLRLADVFRRKRHRKEIRIQPVLWSFQSSGL